MASATIATVAYRPPLATGTSSSTTVSYSTSTAQPGGTNIYLYYFIVPYLDAHVLSPPSWRYAYIFWIFIPAVLAIWAFIYQTNRLINLRIKPYPTQPTIFTASNWLVFPFRWFRSFQIRRLIPTSPAASLRSNSLTRVQTPRWYSSTINIGQAIGLLGFTAILLAISLVGDDYISPTTCTWGGKCPVQVFNQGPPRSTYAPLRARHLESFQASESANRGHQLIVRRDNFLKPRATALSLNPGGWAPFTDPLLAAPNTDVSRNLWTLSSRFGLIAYAMIPFVVSIGLKSWPFNLFAIPWLTHYGFDRASVIHRWTGRLIWIWSTIHTATFTVQLSRDYNPYGRMILTDVWQYYRFNWGVVAYIALTITTCFSFNPLRNRYYEFFYCSHVMLSIVFLVGCIVHYEPLWAWAVIGLVLWGAERAVRLVDWLWFNGFFNGPAQFWSNQPLTNAHSRLDNGNNANSSLLITPNRFGLSVNHQHNYPPFSASPHSHINFDQSNPSVSWSKTASIEIPPGYALVQVLPGHTLRLTLRTVKEVSWMIGQYLLVCVPSVHWWQTHPYTIGSSSSLAKWNVANRNTLGTELVLLLRARSGFSKKFYQAAVQQRAQDRQNSDSSIAANGTMVRCQISRPLGSSGRISWSRYDSVLIVCGGSGISFGLALLEELCFKMCRKASDQYSNNQKGSSWRASRVRLVWVFREYAHLCWVALALKKCLAMVSCEQIQLDLFVSNSLRSSKRASVLKEVLGDHADNKQNFKHSFKADNQLLMPPHLPFSRAHSDSFTLHSGLGTPTAGSVAGTEEELPHSIVGSEDEPAHSALGTEEGHTSDVAFEFTEFEGENQERTPAEVLVSTSVKLEGKRRRRNTLRRQMKNRSSPLINEKKGVGHASVGTEPQDLNLEEQIEKEDCITQDQGINGVGIDLDMHEKQALEELSECVKTGRPKLGRLLEMEIEGSLGSTMVACCGPDSLNSYMRTLVGDKIRKGLRDGSYRENLYFGGRQLKQLWTPFVCFSMHEAPYSNASCKLIRNICCPVDWFSPGKRGEIHHHPYVSPAQGLSAVSQDSECKACANSCYDLRNLWT
ncbi:hypothetical protein O181_006639 [Austropuccinia psidii MF-1]|uniref:FAD-binding FR-type domain-containing protein n=1 Tax=Austropuccinia psidii MF-1 TaxID=1389203 RepID=A0A9Q3BKF4_9BASI|nr:hypothetical protein [Austropuccinia psidii MF-1]